jgi:hypothetical protein
MPVLVQLVPASVVGSLPTLPLTSEVYLKPSEPVTLLPMA